MNCCRLAGSGGAMPAFLNFLRVVRLRSHSAAVRVPSLSLSSDLKTYWANRDSRVPAKLGSSVSDPLGVACRGAAITTVVEVGVVGFFEPGSMANSLGVRNPSPL